MQRVTRPAASGSVYSHKSAQRSYTISGSELLGSVALDTSDVTGQIVMDCLLSPSYMGGTRLEAIASTYSLYRFKKLKIRIVSKSPSVAIGGVMFGITRDVGSKVLDPISYVSSCETMCDLPIWQSGELSVDCKPRFNRQAYYDCTFDGDPDEAFQFRLLAVVSQAYGMIGTVTGAATIALQLYVDYDVEFVGEVAPEIFYAKVATMPLGASFTITTNGKFDQSSIPNVANNVYFFNPALSEYARLTNALTTKVPVRGCYCTGNTTDKLQAYDWPSSAEANPHFSNVQGTDTAANLSTAVRVYQVGTVASNPIYPAATLLLTEKTKHDEVQDESISHTSKQVAGIAPLVTKLTEADRKQAAFNQEMRGIVDRNAHMVDNVNHLLSGLAKIVLGSSDDAAKEVIKPALATFTAGITPPLP